MVGRKALDPGLDLWKRSGMELPRTLAGPRWPRALWGLLLVYFLTASGRVGISDVATTLELSRALIRGETSWPANQIPKTGIRRANAPGERTSQYGLGHSAYMAPYVVVGRVAEKVIGRFPRVMWEEFVVGFSNVPLVGMLLWYLAGAWRRAGLDARQVNHGLWLVGLGTLLWPYSKATFSDTLMALSLFAGWFHWTEGTEGDGPGRRGLLSGVWLGVALLSRRQADAVVPVLVCLAAVDAGRSRSWGAWGRLWIGLVAAVALRLWFNQARFGSPFLEQHPGIGGIEAVGRGWRQSGFERFADVAFGSANGFLPFNLVPLALLGVGLIPGWRRFRGELLVVLALAVSGIVFLSSLRFSPGVCFGSRYLLYLVPFLALGWGWAGGQASLVGRWGLGLVAVPSLVLMLAGVLTDPSPVSMRVPLMGQPFRTFRALAGETVRVLSWNRVAGPESLAGRPDWNHVAFQHPDFWWCHALGPRPGSGAATSR